MIQFFFAFLAGVVTIAGPCILPLLPIILGTATKRTHPSRPLFIVLGFTLSFSVFAVAFAAFGRILGISPDGFRLIGTVVIGLFGFILLFPAIQERFFAKLQPALNKLTPKQNLEPEGLLSGFFLGASLGLVWTPCAGPVLGSILTLVATRQQPVQAGSLLIAYALGAGIPMLGIAYGGQYASQRVRTLARYSSVLQRIFGAIIILVAIGIYTGMDRDFQTWLILHAPWLFPNLQLSL